MNQEYIDAKEYEHQTSDGADAAFEEDKSDANYEDGPDLNMELHQEYRKE